MHIDEKWLKKHYACGEGIKWFKNQREKDSKELIQVLIRSNKKEYLQWANWVIVRTMNKNQKVRYAIYAAKLVLKNFELKYPNEKKPRKAIVAAKAYLRNPCERTKKDAADAADAAAAAAATYAAAAAADAAAADDADAADAAAAAAAAYAAAAAAAAAADAADAYAAAYAAAYSKTLVKILKYGLKITTKGKGKK